MLLRVASLDRSPAVSREPASGRQVSPTGIVLLEVLALLVFYVLSPIPVVYATNHYGYRPGGWIEVLYAPFEFLHEHTSLRQPIERYAGLMHRL